MVRLITMNFRRYRPAMAYSIVHLGKWAPRHLRCLQQSKTSKNRYYMLNAIRLVELSSKVTEFCNIFDGMCTRMNQNDCHQTHLLGWKYTKPLLQQGLCPNLARKTRSTHHTALLELGHFRPRTGREGYKT